MSIKVSHLLLRFSIPLIAIAAIIVLVIPAAQANYGKTIPAASKALDHPSGHSATAILAGGCFWGMEEVFQHVKGVTRVVSGYAGGSAATANYADSSSGGTQQAESVRITYDPDKISYTKLLRIYFSVAHDPTQVDRQSPDVGREYRSEVFATDKAQARVARAYIQQLNKTDVFDKPIATKVSVGKKFFPAESYHQNYAQHHPDSLYIRINDEPKVAALEKRFAKDYRDNPVQ